MDPSPRPAIETEKEEPVPVKRRFALAAQVRDAAAVGGEPDAEAVDLWQEALDQLQHQMTASTFACMLRGSNLVRAAGGTWTIAVPPHAAGWLSSRANPLIERTVSILAGREVRLEYVAGEGPGSVGRPAAPLDGPHAAGRPATLPPAASRSPDSRPPPRSPARDGPSAAPSALEHLLAFDPNSASGGGFWKMGHYANWFWAAYLGTVAWRTYELVVSGDKRPRKTLWTPPRRYSISELARAIANGRQRQPNRAQIRGRYRRVNGQRIWRPGAFDLLTREGVARIEWHAGDVHWRPWKPGGSNRPDHSGLRIVYRISVVTSLPLLTPRQVAQLPAQNQVEHERYLASRAQDPVAWEQIALPTLAGLDPEALKLVRGHR